MKERTVYLAAALKHFVQIVLTESTFGSQTELIDYDIL